MRITFKLLVFFFAINCSFAQVPSYVPKNALCGWWPLTDSLDNFGNNDFNLNGRGFTIDRFGNSNSAIDLDSSFIILPWSKYLDNDSLSISIWIYNGNSAGNRCILKKGNYSNASYEDYYFGIQSDNTFLAGFKGDNSCNPSVGWIKSSSKGAYDNYSNWTHLVFSHVSDTVKIYRNGQLEHIDIIKEPHGFCGKSNLFFGSEWSSFPRYLGGGIDDIGIWNRALSDCEIKQLYKSKQSSYSEILTKSTITSCIGKVQLTATGNYLQYNWSSGDTGVSISIDKSGTYKVSATDSIGCIYYDTIQVNIINQTPSLRDTTICLNSSVELYSEGITQTSTCSEPSGSLRDSLMGWWPFCGNANDYSGNNNHGLISNNSIHITNDRNGNPSSAYQLNNNGFIDLGKLNLPESFSVSLWYKVADSFQIDVTGCEWRESIFSNLNHYQGDATGFEIGISRGLSANQQEQVEIQLRNSQTDPSTYWSGIFDSTSVNKWSHLALTYNSQTDTLSLWQNGILSNQIQTTYLPKLDNSFYLGARPLCGTCNNGCYSPGFYFQGKIDDVGVWSRPLTEAEIEELYTFTDPKKYPAIWSTGDTNSRINVSPNIDTQYWAAITDGVTTCYDTCTVHVSKPIASLAGDSISCFGLNDGSIQLSSSGGISPYAVKWSTGDTTSQLSNLFAGNYKAVVTDAIGCTDTVSFELIEPSVLQLSVVKIDSVNCFNGNDGSASVGAKGGNEGNYSFQWDDPDLQTDSFATGLASGTYKVFVLDSKGCSDSLTIDIGQPTLLKLSLLNSKDPSCYNYADGFISTSVTGGTPEYSYSWNLSPDPASDSVASLNSGDYWVYVQDKNGCLDSLNQKLINPDQIIVKIQEPIRSIKGLPMTLSADINPSNSYEYTWSPAIIFKDQDSEQQPTITIEEDHWIRLVVVDSNGCIGEDSTMAKVLQGAGIIFPNTFSPNDDGLNDQFKPHHYFELLDLKIYNSWGQCIYQSNGSKTGWDGTFAGQDVPAGAYVYQMQVQLVGTQQIINQTGSVTLVR